MLNFAELEERIEQQMKDAHVPGLALAIVLGTEIIYAKGFGVTSIEDNGVAVTPKTLFRIGSVTKPLTGTAIMCLVEAGLLDLDQPVRTYIPWFSLSEAEASERVTLRMLMSHTSGLPTDLDYYGPRDVAGLERFIREKIPHYALTDPCAEKWAYSNPGINIVGYILELVTGKPYAEAMRSLVFEPLAMERTTFDPTIAITYPVAQAHEQVNDETLRVIHRFADNVAYYPSGLAMSTALDLANFALMHLNEGRFHLQAFLRPDTLKEMHRKHVNLTTISDDGYGLTFFVDNYKGLQRISHYGAIGTFSCQFMVIPQKLAVVMVNNRLDNFKDVLLVNFIIDRLLELPDKKGITRK